MANMANPTLRGRVVGALACQKDSYLQALEAEVVSCIKWSAPPQNTTQKKAKKTVEATQAVPDTWLVEFTDSVLFPEGGGQPSDQGTISPLSDSQSEPIPINFVQRQGLQCVYHSPKPLSVGSQVRQNVDFHRRWDLMQQHTGQHLLSAIMDTYDNLETLGWGMGSDGNMNYVDLPRTPSTEEIQSIQDKCNEAIRLNHSITVEILDNVRDGHKLPSDYDQENGVVRAIKIGDIDFNKCCGTHLSQTSHISLILLHHTQPVHSKNCRLFFTSGDRAIRLASASINSLRSVAKLLGSGNTPDEVLASLKKTNETNAESKKKEKKLLQDIAKFEGDRVIAALQAGKNAFVYRASEGLDFINLVVFGIKDNVKDRGLVILAAGEEKKGGPVVIVGEKTAVEGCIAKVKEAVAGIKGGGSGGRWQGKVTEWKKGELDAIQKLVD